MTLHIIETMFSCCFGLGFFLDQLRLVKCMRFDLCFVCTLLYMFGCIYILHVFGWLVVSVYS